MINKLHIFAQVRRLAQMLFMAVVTVFMLLWVNYLPAQTASIGAGAAREQASPQLGLPAVINLTVSLEFTPTTNGWPPFTPLVIPTHCEMAPPNNNPYIADLMFGFCYASQFLADATGQRVKLGQITIYANGEHWADADIRIRAANNYRPSAAVGGVVDIPTGYTPPNMAPITYTTGSVSLGRCWNGRNASCMVNDSAAYSPTWSSHAGYSVIAHELGHYLLTLFDEYIEDADPQWDPSNCEQSLMANPYTITYFWSVAANLEEGCKLRNEQWLLYQMTDYERIAMLAPTIASTGKTRVEYLPPQSGQLPTTPLTLTVGLAAPGTLAFQQLTPHLYWLTMGNNGVPERIVYQGTTTGPRSETQLGEVMLLTTNAASARLYVYADINGGQTYSYTGPIPTTGANISLSADSLNTSMNLDYLMDGEVVTGLVVSLQSGLPITAYVCTPGQSCQPALTVTSSGNTDGSATFSAAQFNQANGFPQYGVVYVRLSTGQEIMRWFERLNGIRQARMRAHAPLADGLVTVQSFATSTTNSGLAAQALIMPAAEGGVWEYGFPTGISGTIGTAFDIDAAPGITNGTNHTLSAPIAVTLFYDPDLLQRMNVPTNQLFVVYTGRGSGSWCSAARPNFTVSTNANLHLDYSVTSAPMQTDGIYALAWGNPQQAPRCPSATAAAVLTITKYSNITQTLPGATIRYELLVRNTGAGATNGAITISDPLPSALTANGTWLYADQWKCSASNNQITCTRPGTLPPGYEITLPITVTVRPTATVGAITNCAQIVAPQGTTQSCHSLNVIVLITAPNNLSANTLSESQLTLTWADRSTSETGFKIERCQVTSGGTCNNFSENAAVRANVTTYTDPGLLANTPYCYRIRAYNNGGTSAYSPAVCRSTAPQPPSNLTTQVISKSQINLTWRDNATSESGFKIERCAGNNCLNFTQIAIQNVNSTTYANLGLPANSLFCYRVRAYNVNGHSSYSNKICPKTLALSASEVDSSPEEATSEPTVSALQLQLLPQTQSNLQLTIACSEDVAVENATLVVGDVSIALQPDLVEQNRYSALITVEYPLLAEAAYPILARWSCANDGQMQEEFLGTLVVTSPADTALQPRAFLPLITR